MLKKNLYTCLVLLFCLFFFTGCEMALDFVPENERIRREQEADRASKWHNEKTDAELKAKLAQPNPQPDTVKQADSMVEHYEEELRNQHHKTPYLKSTQDIVDAQVNIVRLKKLIKKTEAQRKILADESVGCFLPDALVQMGDGSFKPFVEVVPGDIVMSYDIGHDKQVSRAVVELYSVKSNHLYKINNEFETTGGERLLTQNGWKEINRLKKGDIIHVNGEMIEVFAIEFNRTNHTLHNMQVDNTHNFYVSTINGTKYLVHNSGGGGK